jgi:hypothetical protein
VPQKSTLLEDNILTKLRDGRKANPVTAIGGITKDDNDDGSSMRK